VCERSEREAGSGWPGTTGAGTGVGTGERSTPAGTGPEVHAVVPASPKRFLPFFFFFLSFEIEVNLEMQ
jgi:hypothetical protein